MLLWDRVDSAGTRRPQVLQIMARPGGGAGMLVILLTRELNRLGYRTQFVTGRCDPLDLDMSYLLTPDDPVEWIPEMSSAVSLKSDFIAFWRLYRLMRASRPAIVQTHTAKAGLLGRVAARLAGVPVVIHTFHGHVMSGYFPKHISRAIQFTERILGKFTNKIFVLCPQQERDMVERFRVVSQEKVEIVPPGLDLEPFRKIALPEKTGWLTVAWIGRLVAIKDIGLLVETMHETFRANDRIRFIVAGDGPQRALMEAAQRRWPDERLDWLGWTRDVESVIKRSDILIQTSRNEGAPTALIQGMAAGRPFVSTPAGGVVDMVTGPGVREESGGEWFANAVLVEPDPRAFASVLARFQVDRSRLNTMGREAARFAVGRYSLELLARNYERIYGPFLGHDVGAEEATVMDA